MSELNYDGISKLARDLPGQVEFNRRKNVEQDQRLATLSSQVSELISQTPAGFLPKVYYGLTQGSQTYRFTQDAELNVVGLPGNIGDAFEILSPTETQEYISAIGIKTANDYFKISIKGDYNVNVSTFSIVNMTDGTTISANLGAALSLQDASYLGNYSAQDNADKQITVLYDIETNEQNIIFASVDFNNDGIYNWIRIGGYQNGINGKSLFSISAATASTIFGIAVAGDSVVATEDFIYDGITFTIGEVFQIDTITPLSLTSVGSLRGPQGVTGATGSPGSPGQNGYTPYILNDYWYINGFDTGVKALGTDGINGTNGQSFQMKSGLYSTPANYGQAGNDGPNGETLLELPTLPQASGMTGYAYVVYDPLTTPLDPYYDLYYCNDNDNDWTIIHPFSGLKGADGTNGYTPYIYNNNWYINGVNTGVQATGDTGAQGEQGISFYTTSANVSNISSISGSRVDDYIINVGSGTLTILGVSASVGDVIKIIDATTGTKVGNIRGPQGTTGSTGATGATPVITGAATVDNNVGTPGVTVVKTGTDAAPTLTFNFVNLKGATGATGATGAGVPSGGTSGQILKKNSSNNYDTSWISPTATPTNGSVVPFTSGGAFTELAKRLPLYSISSTPWDTAPTNGSTKPVTSGGIYSYLRSLTSDGSLVRNTTYFSNGALDWFQYGPLIFVHIFDLTPSQSVPHYTTIFSGLPATSNDTTYMLTSQDSNNVGMRVRLEGTTLRAWYNSSNVGTEYYGFFVYSIV